ncbi:Ras-GEF domain-containing protein [Rhodotorula paludigena]|uniref:Ras-GEF domain-containing protein n=1 Tax=Rhodotorula paludigena TaxID=86838 RepID=UPI0031748D8D
MAALDAQKRLPRPVARASPPAAPSDLALAMDGSFVETTSEAAARAMARFYAEQSAGQGAGEEWKVQSRTDERGRTVYRIRPLDAPSVASPTSSSSSAASSGHLPFARPSHQPIPSPKQQQQQPSIALHRSSLRQSRSIPLLRSPDQPAHAEPLLSPSFPAASASTADGAVTEIADKAPRQQHYLRKSPSSPSFRAPAVFSSPTSSSSLAPPLGTLRPASRARSAASSSAAAGASGEGDVLGRILGWRADVGSGSVSGSSAAGEAGRSGGRRREGRSGRIRGLREVLAGGARGTKGSKGNESDRSDLPEDLVEELEESEAPASPASSTGNGQHPFAMAKQRPSRQRGRFGTGVRIRRLPTVGVAPPDGARDGHHPMREVSSSDSIRTATAADPLLPSLLPPSFPFPASTDSPDLPAPPPRTPRTRFQDPHVFDLFHRDPTSPSSTSGPSAPPPVSQPLPFGYHGRLDSASSLASSRSSASGAGGSGSGTGTSLEIALVPRPGDDPRFVIWGTTAAPAPAAAVRSPKQAGRKGSVPVTEPASPSSAARRWSVSMSPRGTGSGSGSASSAGTGVSSPPTSVRDSVGSKSSQSAADERRILMAATVERLVAELTSKIAPALLRDFFLTFRHFLAPLDLLHLLVARFTWAMQPPLSSADDALRRVVRVRTFVVLRYWLLNHFQDDFVPDRALRSELARWLNECAKSDEYRAANGGRELRLIKALKKTARRCKDAYLAGGTKHTADGTSPVLGTNGVTDDDVDLDFGGVAGAAFGSFRGGNKDFLSASTSSASSAQLASPHHHSTTDPLDALASSAEAGAPSNPLARSFSSALGTLGRFKRKLASASLAARHGNEADASGRRGALELEKGEEGDLLWVKGGVERYLEYWGIQRESEGTEEAERTPELVPAGTSSEERTPRTDEGEQDALTPKPDVFVEQVETIEPLAPSALNGVGLGIDGAQDLPVAALDYAFPPPKPASVAAAAAPPAFSLAPGAFGPYSSSERPHSVRIELDDLDDSDSDLDEDVIEAKKTLKRLPATHDLRLVAAGIVAPPALAHVQLPPMTATRRRSFESEASSYGFVGSRDPLGWGNELDGPPRESVLFLDEEVGYEPSQGVTVIPNFVLEGLVDSDDDDEPGDVEAALRRLEGLVDDSKEREKARRVERQMERSSRLEQERLRALQAGEAVPPPLAPDDDRKCPSMSMSGESADVATASLGEAIAAPVSAGVRSSSPPPVGPVLPASIQPPEPAPRKPSVSSSQSGVSAVDSRKPSMSRIFSLSARPSSARPGLPASFVARAPAPPTHRSFVLFCRTETLAQQLTLIERDMLRLLSYQELASGSWRERMGETDVLDWEAYVKDRRRADVEAKREGTSTASAVQDLIARFNLTANWVCSEILLTANIDERAMLVAKFIRLAFKCYCQSNFQTLTQIVHGLQIPDVERLHKTWARVPAWEMRKFRGMQVFVSHLKNFKHLRELTTAILSENGAADLGSTMSSAAAPAVKGCIPFIGLFLRDLATNAELPTFLDPTAPNASAAVNSAGSLTAVADPSAFADFPPLPPDTSLAPLVNVHKFRVLAQTVQRVLAFQELASRYAFEPTPKVYFKCLKIRCLEQGVMRELSTRLEA